MTHALERLPIVMEPHTLESMSSWWLRLAEANAKTVTNLEKMFTGNVRAHWKWRRDPEIFVTEVYGDLRRVEFYELGRLTGLEDKKLLRLTLSLFCLKDVATEQELSFEPPDLIIRRFMGTGITKTQSFCPLCIDEFGCYFLSWRLLSFQYCGIHLNALSDKCDECCSPLPLALHNSKSRIGRCPYCGFDIRKCKLISIGEADPKKIMDRQQALELELKGWPSEKGDRHFPETSPWPGNVKLLDSLSKPNSQTSIAMEMQKIDITELDPEEEEFLNFVRYYTYRWGRKQKYVDSRFLKDVCIFFAAYWFGDAVPPLRDWFLMSRNQDPNHSRIAIAPCVFIWQETRRLTWEIDWYVYRPLVGDPKNERIRELATLISDLSSDRNAIPFDRLKREAIALVGLLDQPPGKPDYILQAVPDYEEKENDRCLFDEEEEGEEIDA